MRYLIRITVLFALLFVSGNAHAEDKKKEFTFETEFTYDDKNGNSFSQYVFFNSATKKDGIGLNGYMRYFDVEKAEKQAEFVLGPTFNLYDFGELQTNVGFTTDGSIHAGGTLFTSIGGKPIVFITDPKVYLNRNPSTLFQKLFIYDLFSVWGVPVTFRAEHFLVNWDDNIFLRVGPQVPIFQSVISEFIGSDASLTVSPFYEVETNSVGSFLTLTIVR